MNKTLLKYGDKVQIVNVQGCNGLRGRVLQRLKHEYLQHPFNPTYLVQFDRPVLVTVNGQRVPFEDRMVFNATSLLRIP